VIDPFVSLDAALGLDPVLVDLGSNADGVPPRDAFDAGHVLGARFVDLDRWLAAPPSAADGRHPLPDPAVFAKGMGLAGIGPDDTVVAYDRVGGVFAARLVWMLRAVGVRAALLDGGLAAWTARFGTDGLEAGETPVDPVAFPTRSIPASRLADVGEIDAIAAVAGAGAEPATVLLDARETARFHGAAHPLDAAAGHIPGARSLSCRENIGSDGRLLPIEELRARLAAVGAVDGADVISSCGSGVTACHTLLVLEHLGHDGARLYPGSWSQWTGTGRPVAV
jgi:thiosulfate/3-mercaptopyruvate sulfurtransferase